MPAIASELGAEIRRQRKMLKVSSTVAAEAAGLSRMTWHRIEKGELTVAFGAWLAAAHVVGLTFETAPLFQDAEQNSSGEKGQVIPVRVRLADFPQLRNLAWQVTGAETLTPAEALDIYERNWRHLDESALIDEERVLIAGLKVALNREF